MYARTYSRFTEKMREFIVISQNYCKLHGKFSDESSSHNDMLCGGWQAHLLPQACRSSDADRKSNLDLLLIFN